MDVLEFFTDDYLRNHGFLCSGQGSWRLAPAYDLNTVSIDIRPRILASAIDHDNDMAFLDLAMSVADYFELGQTEARSIAAEIDRIALAFEHEDSRIYSI
jgi:serine/threonine-protein kinase HipA